MTSPVVVVREPTVSLVVVREPAVTRVTAPGPQGPPGPTGATGPISVGFVHTQSSAAATWVIDHGLNRKVQVSIFDLTQTVVYADVTHGTPNQTTITFPSPVTGSAVLS